ncbi:hypothetical protein ACRAWF_11105 [Streptomyces sp. L7]
MTIKGTWTLNQNLSWARVLVHLPDTGAQTRQATYTVGGSDSTSPDRVVLQRAGGWVSIGAFHFTDAAGALVELDGGRHRGRGHRVDAVAFQPSPESRRTPSWQWATLLFGRGRQRGRRHGLLPGDRPHWTM